MAAKKMKAATLDEPVRIESLFSKEQLLSSKRFHKRRDILNALLSPDKQYTIQIAEQEVSKYMKGQVK